MNKAILMCHFLASSILISGCSSIVDTTRSILNIERSKVIVENKYTQKIVKQGSVSTVYLDGEVRMPGAFEVTNRGVAFAINVAEGVTDRTCPRSVRVGGKNINDQDVQGRINIQRIVKNNENDILLPEGWVISLPQSSIGCGEPNFNELLASYIEEASKQPEQMFDMRLIEMFNAER